MKKALAIILTIAMLATMTLTVFAAPETSEAEEELETAAAAEDEAAVTEDSEEDEAVVAVPATAAALPSKWSIAVDGAEAVSLDMYNINGSNYIKLRDLAFLINGTEKQFEVGYDEETKAIALTCGEAYTEAGNELEGKGDAELTVSLTTSNITHDGEPVDLAVYFIMDNNYFKLRDLAELIDFNVTPDENNVIILNTAESYDPAN